jgi:hypothetical protein
MLIERMKMNYENTILSFWKLTFKNVFFLGACSSDESNSDSEKPKNDLTMESTVSSMQLFWDFHFVRSENFYK